MPLQRERTATYFQRILQKNLRQRCCFLPGSIYGLRAHFSCLCFYTEGERQRGNVDARNRFLLNFFSDLFFVPVDRLFLGVLINDAI
jgi:hypothetical protein